MENIFNVECFIDGEWEKVDGGRCKRDARIFTLLYVKYAQYTGYYVDKFQRREQACRRSLIDKLDN